jgi:SAM-dependent methyltransferase
MRFTTLLLSASSAAFPIVFTPAETLEKSCEQVFTAIYDNLDWGLADDGDPSSGWGSFPVYAKPYMDFLVDFINSNQIQSVVDLGCGTWEFSRYIDWGNVNYLGVDVVEKVVQLNQKKFGKQNITFIQGDILAMPLPDAELMVCKDVLQHLQHEDIKVFLERTKKYKHRLITNDLAISDIDSVDITNDNRENVIRGDNRPLDLTKPPFNENGTKILTYPNSHHIKQVLYIKSECSSESLACLNKRISEDNLRYKTFEMALKLITERKARIIVETGTARHGDSNCSGDGCSTLIFCEWAHQNGAILYSVDIDANAIRNAEHALDPASKTAVQWIHGDSVAFLKDFNQPIDFLYLDSYDYEEWNPEPSQRHHLNEVIAAIPWFTKDTVIMIDDSDDGFLGGGKGKLVIEYLLERGWNIVMKGHQVVLVRQ